MAKKPAPKMPMQMPKSNGPKDHRGQAMHQQPMKPHPMDPCKNCQKGK